MITMTYDQIRKIELFDRLFNSIDPEYLENLIQSEEIISKLKGTNDNSGFLMSLVRDRDGLLVKTMALENDIQMLRSDMQTLVKLILKPYDYNSQSDANILKTKFNIY